MAVFRCCNIVIHVWSFCLSARSWLFPADITLRQASSTDDPWRLQSYNFLTPSPAKRESSLSAFLTKPPELNLIGSDWVMFPDPVTVARKKRILIGSYVHTWPTWTERGKRYYSRKKVIIKERNGCWAGTKQWTIDFYHAEGYGIELANEYFKTTGNGRRLILQLWLLNRV